MPPTERIVSFFLGWKLEVAGSLSSRWYAEEKAVGRGRRAYIWAAGDGEKLAVEKGGVLLLVVILSSFLGAGGVGGAFLAALTGSCGGSGI
jgi:hypothetical protein